MDFSLEKTIYVVNHAIDTAIEKKETMATIPVATLVDIATMLRARDEIEPMLIELPNKKKAFYCGKCRKYLVPYTDVEEAMEYIKFTTKSCNHCWTKIKWD